tara:strand:+ start:37 stop:333 length:297 start_codon:yes stop_codon:yes gene_type:complete
MNSKNKEVIVKDLALLLSMAQNFMPIFDRLSQNTDNGYYWRKMNFESSVFVKETAKLLDVYLHTEDEETQKQAFKMADICQEYMQKAMDEMMKNTELC